MEVWYGRLSKKFGLEGLLRYLVWEVFVEVWFGRLSKRFGFEGLLR